MTAYTVHADSIFDTDKPILGSTHQEARDNVIAASEGAAGAPRFAFTKITSITASSSASIEFDSDVLDSGLYESYQFVFDGVLPATDGATLKFQTSTDDGSSYASSSSNYNNSTGTSDDFIKIALDVANGSVGGVHGSAEFFGAHTTDYKFLVGDAAFINSSSGYDFDRIGGTRLDTTLVNAVRFLFSSGNIASGTIAVYGRKA